MKNKEAVEAMIAAAVRGLDEAVWENSRLPIGDRNDTVTLVTEKGRSESVMVNGSAHMLGPLFEELFNRRPELRSVVSDVLRTKYRIENR